MNRISIHSSAIAAGAAALLLIGSSVPAQAETEAASSENTTDCAAADLTGEEAVAKWGPELEPVQLPGSYDPVGWDLEAANASGYDPDADLSWATVPVENAAAFTPVTVMMFHEGIYIGTATEHPKGFEPTVEQLDDGKLSITYPYLTGQEPGGDPQGEAVSTFTWDEASQSVIHSGEFPPAAAG